MRVLIADDQRDVGRALANLVRICNHEIVDVVGSGLEAIQAYNRHHPDLVLMDYRMPKLNGATACRNIISKDPAARVILVTAWSPSDDASLSGALSVLPKPVSLQQLEVTLNRVAEMISPDSPPLVPSPSDEVAAATDFSAPSFDLPVADSPAPVFQIPTPSSDFPTPVCDLQASNVDFQAPLTVLPTPTFDLPQPEEACVVDQEKIPGKRRPRRRAQRVRAR